MPDHVVAVLARPGASIVELGAPADVFTHERYGVRFCAAVPGPVRLAAGLSIEAPYGLDVLAAADTVIVVGGVDGPAGPPLPITRALRTAAGRGARIVATGTGVLVLAAAGLPTGRHPPAGAGGRIHTCAGGAATVDLCRELVRHDAGHGTGDLADVLEWATARLAEPLGLADLAKVAHVSPRTLARRFEAALGTTPMQWILAQRLRRAVHLLETTCEPIERIARTTGFGSTSNFRLQFARATGVSPQSYRRAAREPSAPRRAG